MKTPPLTHQHSLSSSARRFQTLRGVLHLLLDLRQQSLQLIHLLPLVWESLRALGLVQQLLQFVCQTEKEKLNALIISSDATLNVWLMKGQKLTSEHVFPSIQPALLTQPALYDRDGTLQLLDGLAVLEV